MAVVRWRPLREMTSLQREMNRVFDAFFQDNEENAATSTWYPSVDISETPEKIDIYAELPGLTKEDIKLTIRENLLQLSGEKNRKDDEADANYHRVERIYGTFSRSFTLPAKVQVDKVGATFKDGVLHLELPKAEEEKARLIQIK
ncbi:Hsp20/alpha crystallin family protein [candidate division KSB1 bacterium]|nr:Hsp20/alpha crystallin family protein [candidate division KSB1 bacterium]RQW06324.1 MAG: Hsp20/alpha crystallin family protein [candidate division KSB1 bacterium]